ncbi:chromosomal replication initiator protein DnaA [Parvibacter caecicola]|uniref:Chromosomal replication initiator protein DnaA n=1 Tax=Parvibacter caecicola TaxID=747645 RepID=A0A4T9T6V8_9ACTN|nr:chromosomal replication initiator protein DnaA [Parvibacter caecicola]TJW10240.1 chromosomal replication initiator protein DnaA [Parvibacter caecicola]
MDSSLLNDYWQNVWRIVKEYDSVDASQVDAFFARLHPQVISEGFFMLTAENEFLKNWVEAHYLPFISQALQDMFEVPFNVVLAIDSAPAAPVAAPAVVVAPSPAPSVAAPVPTAPITPPLQPYNTRPASATATVYEEAPAAPTQTAAPQENASGDGTSSRVSTSTFENFVIGDSNRMAYSMALAVAENPSKEPLNPLFIYGKSGLGKTHLMRAIENYIRDSRPYLRTLYVDAADLLNDYTIASTTHDTEKNSFVNFKKRYEDADVLLIDDIQHLQGKKQTLNIVFQIFNRLRDMNKQIVLSADRAPKNIDIDERYSSRFSSGGTVDIQPPEIETKLGIIRLFINEYQRNAGGDSIVIPDEVQLFIAENSSPNIRELKGAVTTVIYHMTYFGKTSMTADELNALLASHFTGGPTRNLTIDDIQKEVEKYFHVKHTDMLSSKRSRDIAYPRQIAIFLCRQMLDVPFATIGKRFNRDHSTAMHSYTSIEKKINQSREVREEIENIKQMILEG